MTRASISPRSGLLRAPWLANLLMLGGSLLLVSSEQVLAQSGSPDPVQHKSREERIAHLQSLSWEMEAVRLEDELVIDGKLDDTAWKRAKFVTDFYQTETNEGLPASQRNRVAVMYDDTNLYIGFRAFDSEPGRAQAWAMFRDEAPSADDALAIMIDPFNDHRSAVFLGTNANGLVFDMLQTGERSDTRNRNWDAVWEAKGSTDAEGWQVEIALPFKSLRFELPATGEEAVFGIGFKRNIPRNNEEAVWPFVSNNSTWYRPAELGHLRGLRNIRPGRAIEIRPYALGGGSLDYDLDQSDGRAEIGGDVKWGITPSLTADFTVNTDFAQEEVDVQQINFTRFSLFFPEKRQIFLEGQRMFQFGVPREADLVFTRRIGLSGDGEILPLLAGARVSGRQGRTSIGAMNMQTGEELDFAAENFTVLRLRRDVFSRSSFGALFTNREGGGTFNRLVGADVNLFFNRVWFIEGYAARVFEPGDAEGRDSAYGRFAYDSDRLGINYRYLHLGDNFRPGVGFVRRPDSRDSSAELRFSPRPALSWIRQLDFMAGLNYITDQQNVLETRSQVAEVAATFETGDRLTLAFTNQFEFLPELFNLRSDVTIDPGAYRFDTLGLRLNTFRRRKMVWTVSVNTGGFWDGDRDTLSLRANYRVNKNVGLDTNYAMNRISLPQGTFTTHLFSTRFQLAFRTDLVLMSLLQYNHDTRSLSSNIRFNWIPKPGTDFFIVYNELDDWRDPFRAKSRSLSIKFNYLFAL